MDFKLMMVAASTDKRQAKIMITGSWLDRFGFSPETIVTVFGQNGHLTMKAQGTGLDVYKQVVAEVRKQKGHMLQVFNWTRKKTEAHLILDGPWLEKQGFAIGDPILVRFEPGLIRIKHVPLDALGFSQPMTASYRITKVRIDSLSPVVSINASWLQDYGFMTGQAAALSYESDFLSIQPCQKNKTRASSRTMPKQVNILLKRNVPSLRMAGLWLLDIDYHPGDLLIIQCRENQLHIKRLEKHYLHF